MKSKQFLLCLVCFSLCFSFTTQEESKQTSFSDFDFISTRMEQLGFDYSKTDTSETLDTGDVIAKTTLLNKGLTKENTIKRKKNKKRKSVRTDREENLVDSKTEYLDENRIRRIETLDEVIEFTYDDDKDLESVTLNGETLISKTKKG